MSQAGFNPEIVFIVLTSRVLVNDRLKSDGGDIMSNLTSVVGPHLIASRRLISDFFSFGKVGEQIGEAVQRGLTFKVTPTTAKAILEGAIGDEPTYGDLKDLSIDTIRIGMADNGVTGIPANRVQMLVSAFQAVAALGHNAPVCSDPRPQGK